MTRNKRRALTLLLAIGAAVGAFRCAQDAAADYPLLSCERHEITHDGRAIIGIEDLAYDAGQNQIYLSAYDRRTHAAGGLYRFSPQDLGAAEKLTPAAPINYPHGFDLTRTGPALSLTVIERDLSDKKTLSARLRRFTWQDDSLEMNEIALPQDDSLLCNANDLITFQGEYLITADHSACSYSGRKRENVFKANSAHLVGLNAAEETPVKPLIGNLYFANGIIEAPAKTSSPPEIYIAETRKKRLSAYSKTPRGFAPKPHINLPGGPDNLTYHGADIWAALHPNLIRFAAYRASWIKTARSRIAHIKPTGQIDIYDIAPNILSGATSALRLDQSIYVSGAFESAIAICKFEGKANE